MDKARPSGLEEDVTAAMVKWYNMSLPRISRGFDYLWPHEYKNKHPSGCLFCSCDQKDSTHALSVVTLKAFELDHEERNNLANGVLRQ